MAERERTALYHRPARHASASSGAVPDHCWRTALARGAPGWPDEGARGDQGCDAAADARNGLDRKYSTRRSESYRRGAGLPGPDPGVRADTVTGSETGRKRSLHDHKLAAPAPTRAQGARRPDQPARKL